MIASNIQFQLCAIEICHFFEFGKRIILKIWNGVNKHMTAF